MYLFFEKRSTFWVWLQSDLESALKSDLEAVQKKTLYKKTRWVMFATGLYGKSRYSSTAVLTYNKLLRLPNT